MDWAHNIDTKNIYGIKKIDYLSKKKLSILRFRSQLNIYDVFALSVPSIFFC